MDESQGYRLLRIDAIQYPALRHLDLQPSPRHYYSLGSPVRYIVEGTLDFPSDRLVSTPWHKQFSGKFITFKTDFSESGKQALYFVDVYFSNGLLDQQQLTEYQQELRQFALVLQRTLVGK